MGRLEDFFNSQLAQQQKQMQPPLVQSPYQGIGTGLLGMGGAIGNAMGWYENSTTAIPEAYQTVLQPITQLMYPYKNPFNRLKRFFRINEEIQYNEGQIISEPLDELRIKVAEWLYN